VIMGHPTVTALAAINAPLMNGLDQQDSDVDRHDKWRSAHRKIRSSTSCTSSSSQAKYIHGSDSTGMDKVSRILHFASVLMGSLYL
jgi:hypothetical protein